MVNVRHGHEEVSSPVWLSVSASAPKLQQNVGENGPVDVRRGCLQLLI